MPPNPRATGTAAVAGDGPVVPIAAAAITTPRTSSPVTYFNARITRVSASRPKRLSQRPDGYIRAYPRRPSVVDRSRNHDRPAADGDLPASHRVLIGVA